MNGEEEKRVTGDDIKGQQLGPRVSDADHIVCEALWPLVLGGL